MKELRHQQTARTQDPKRESTPPRQRSSKGPVQALQSMLQHSRSPADLSAELLEELAQAVGNGNLLSLLQSSGVTPPDLRQAESLPPEQWDQENIIKTSPPDLLALTHWPEDRGAPIAPSPLRAMADRAGGP